jgi:hypothetical protein
MNKFDEAFQVKKLTSILENALGRQGKEAWNPEDIAIHLVDKNLRFKKKDLLTLCELRGLNEYNSNKVWKVLWNFKKELKNLKQEEKNSWVPRTILIKKK